MEICLALIAMIVIILICFIVKKVTKNKKRPISILLIIIVLLQSSKAEGGAQILSGNTTDLFKNRKERGAELVVTRITMVLGLAFFVICLIESFL